MPKITRNDIIGPLGLGFTKEMFSPLVADDTAFFELIDSVIAEQATDLAERVGQSAYNASANLANLKKAEKALTAAELFRRRINILLGTTPGSGQEVSTASERQQRKDYLDDAEKWIGKIVQGAIVDQPSDFASGSLVTGHFE